MSFPLKTPFQKFILRPKRFAIFEACGIGVVSGLAAVFLRWGSGWLAMQRIQLASSPNMAWILPLIGLVGGWLAGMVVERVAPSAVGSGIPQVKAALAKGAVILNLRVAIAKLLSVILVMGAGINLGRQGPTVHIGAALAAQFDTWMPTSPEYRRQLLAAGAAAGLAAGFNAPIAGVLFVVEELIHDFSGLTLGTAILASFIGAVVARLLGDRGLSLNAIMAESHASFSLHDVPFFLLLGVLAGVLGAAFSRGVFVTALLNRRMARGLAWKIGAVGGLSGFVTMLLPQPYWDNIGLSEFVSQGLIQWHFALVGFIVKFCLTLIAAGSGAPGGIFAPALILGSSLGFVIGTFAHQLDGMLGGSLGIGLDIGSNATYALAGMGAFFSAVTKGPITAIVIVFEMTTDFNLVLPLMISSVVSYLTADLIYSGSIYNRLLLLQGIHLDHEDASGDRRGQQLTQLTAGSLMQPNVETLSSTMRLRDALDAFARSHHRGFPVVDQGKLVGIVTQTDLAETVRDSLALEETTLEDIMTSQPVTVKPTDPLSHVLYLLSRFKISRLPVTEGHRLVGIITRADIIRAESDQLSGNDQPIGHASEPSYVAYRTQGPQIGQGRILVLLRNPETIPYLMRMAVAIAHDRNYELDCLHIMVIPRGCAPDETVVDTREGRDLLVQAEQLRHDWAVPIHTHIRVSHNPAQAALEAIQDHHIDLVLLGWRCTTHVSGRVFGDLVDTLIRQAPCDVMVVKLALKPQFERWLLPVAGGPNAQASMALLPGLLSLGDRPTLKVSQVLTSHQTYVGQPPVTKAAIALQQQLSCPVSSEFVWNASISDGVLKLAWQEEIDVIILGASRDGLLQQAIRGNIPKAIARRSDGTVILVRGTVPHATAVSPHHDRSS